MRIAVFPGSFDPVTLGHVDIAKRALAFADKVVFAVGENPSKRYTFDAAERLEMVRSAIAGVDGLTAEAMPGLLVDMCAKLKASVIVRGLRGGADLFAEQPMALMNRHLSGVETVFVLADPALTHIASSLVKDVARHGGDVTDLVPPGVAEALVQRTEEKQ